MRIAVIGDVHGSSKWSSLITRNEKEYDKLVFLGDYVDDWWISDSASKRWQHLLEYGFRHSEIAYWQSRLPIRPNCDYRVPV